MAVISELIDAGLNLKEQGNHQAAIEHFKQLHQTYPDHPRIMFELAGSWQAFGVPEQALPLYRRLMALPKSQNLPPKEMPRLYTQMGASLRLLGQYSESLEIIEEGLALYPDYRPLRAYRMFALHSAGYHQNAMLDALELMLESLAPTKWDLYELEIADIVQAIRERVPPPDTDELEEWVFDEYWTEEGKKAKPDAEEADTDNVSVDAILDEAEAITNGEDVAPAEETPPAVTKGKVQIEDVGIEEDEAFEVEVKVVDKKDKPKPKKKASKSKQSDDQFGKKPVKIDINAKSDDDDETEDTEQTQNADDDSSASTSGKINIPVDFD